MKTLNSTILMLIVALTALKLDAQSGTQYVRLTVTENSNLPGQAPASINIAFDAMGNDSFALPDSGDVLSPAHWSTEVFPYTMSADSTIITLFDSRSTLDGYRTIPMGFLSQGPSTIKVVAELSSSDSHTPLPGFVWIENLVTGERYSVLDTTTLNIMSVPHVSDNFVLHVGPQTSSTGTDAFCNIDGTILVKGPGANNFTYELTKGATVIYSGVIAGWDTIFHNVTPGVYLGVITLNGMPVDSSVLTISGNATVVADFTTDYLTYGVGDVVNIQDYSVGGNFYEWRFGNGDSSTAVGSLTYTYAVAGQFNITLMLADPAGCMATHTEVVTIVPLNLHASGTISDRSSYGQDPNNENATDKLSGLSDDGDHSYGSFNMIVVTVKQPQTTRVTITSVNGAVVVSEVQSDNRSEYSVPAPGLYLVTIGRADGTAKSETIVVQ